MQRPCAYAEYPLLLVSASSSVDFGSALTFSVVTLVSVWIPLENIKDMFTAIMTDTLCGAFLHDASTDRVLSLEPCLELPRGHVDILLELPDSGQTLQLFVG